MKKPRKSSSLEGAPKKRPSNRLRLCHVVEEAKAKVNREKALRMKVLGMPNVAIAKELHVDESTVRRYIEQELAHTSPQTAKDRETLREIACQRVETAINEAMHLLVDRGLEIETVIPGERGDKVITVERFKAVTDLSDVVIKGVARLAALRGLDAPKEVKQENTGMVYVVPQSQLDETMAARVAILRKAREEMAAVPMLKAV